MAGTDTTKTSVTGGPAVILVDPQLGENIGTSEADMPDEVSKKPRKPDYPLINSEAKGAPELPIPVEITKILYRQMLLWIGMLVSPFIFGLGLVSTFLIYWVQYGTVVYLHKRPKKILDHFAAADTQRDFYGAFLIANAFAFSFFVMFSTTPANPMCGPLRSVECYEGAKLGNLTACAADAVAQRKNYNWLSDTLLPVDDSQPQAVFALAAGNNTQPVAPSYSILRCARLAAVASTDWSNCTTKLTWFSGRL